MRTRVRSFGVFSLSAIDLFASAMGAFMIITIILMPDYQKVAQLDKHMGLIESLAEQEQSRISGSKQDIDSLHETLAHAQTLQKELEAEQDIISSEIETIRAQLQARNDQPPPPPPTDVESEENTGSNLVSFRFLGLKTDKTRILFMVDMNKYLASHQDLVWKTVARALESLQPGYEFGILGFQQLDAGPRYHRWPADGSLAVMSRPNRARALRFVRGLAGQFEGASSLQSAFQLGFTSPADAIVLISDGLPNPTYNSDLPPRALAQNITIMNSKQMEIHTVMIGDYFRYKGTVEFMEGLARGNSGGFLALAQ